MTKVVIVPDVAGYAPPKGWKIITIEKLSDGTYAVTLEPQGFPSVPRGGGGFTSVSASPLS